LKNNRHVITDDALVNEDLDKAWNRKIGPHTQGKEYHGQNRIPSIGFEELEYLYDCAHIIFSGPMMCILLSSKQGIPFCRAPILLVSWHVFRCDVSLIDVTSDQLVKRGFGHQVF
jgi:hypothetical protein